MLAKWVARGIILSPPLALVAFDVYANYQLFTNPKVSPWLFAIALLLDMLTFVGSVLLVVGFWDRVAHFFRWLWHMAEFQTN